MVDMYPPQRLKRPFRNFFSQLYIGHIDMPPKRQSTKKSMYKKKPKYTRYRKRSMAPNRSLVKAVKAINLGLSETKYKTKADTMSNLYHDNLYDYQLWDSSGTANIFPSQGSSDAQRIGDRIMCQGIRIRMALQIPWDRRNLNLKIWFLPFNNGQGSPTTYGEFFHNVSGNSQLDPVQTKRWPGLKFLGNYSVRPKDRDGSESSTDSTIYVNKWISMKKAVYFKADGSNTPTNLREYGS